MFIFCMLKSAEPTMSEQRMSVEVYKFYCGTFLLHSHSGNNLASAANKTILIDATKNKFKLYSYSRGNTINHMKTGVLCRFPGEYG